jgi:hypothetical protein
MRAPLLAALALAAALLTLSLPASATDLGLVPVSIGDRDGDGLPEVGAGGIVGGPCGCDCPVAGVLVEADAAGQHAEGWAALVLLPICGVGAIVDVDPGAVAPNEPPFVSVVPYLSGALGN